MADRGVGRTPTGRPSPHRRAPPPPDARTLDQEALDAIAIAWGSHRVIRRQSIPDDRGAIGMAGLGSGPSAARESVKKLARFQFDTVVFGHGDPVEGGADAAVAEVGGHPLGPRTVR